MLLVFVPLSERLHHSGIKVRSIRINAVAGLSRTEGSAPSNRRFMGIGDLPSSVATGRMINGVDWLRIFTGVLPSMPEVPAARVTQISGIVVRNLGGSIGQFGGLAHRGNDRSDRRPPLRGSMIRLHAPAARCFSGGQNAAIRQRVKVFADHRRIVKRLSDIPDESWDLSQWVAALSKFSIRPTGHHLRVFKLKSFGKV